MSCKLDATERSMHNLRYFSKGVLNIWLLPIHTCPLLQLWSSLACHFRALLLLQNVSWQIVYMLFNLAKVVVVDPCMLWTCSCLGLFHKHVFLMMLCLSCHAMTCGEWIELVKEGTCCYCFPDRFCYILLLCKHVATNHSMHNLEMCSKHVLIYVSSSIHPCPW